MKRFGFLQIATLACFALLCAPLPASAQDDAATAKTLRELVDKVKKANQGDKRLNKEREDEFRQDLDRLRRTLAQAERKRANEEAISERLEGTFAENEKQLAQLEDRLNERLGTLGELFGVFRQVAGDTRENLKTSITSAQYPDRIPTVANLAEEKELPDVDGLKLLWLTILDEMAYTGEVAGFDTTVVAPSGEAAQRRVVRVGPFNAISEDGIFLAWDNDTQQLKELKRQPAGRHRSAAEDLFEATPGEVVAMSVDPSRGSILGLLIDTPTTLERVDQGGIVGYIIIALGAIGLVVLLYRLVRLSSVGGRMRSQSKSNTPNPGNPLGRVMAVYEQNKDVDVETLELKLDECIIKEVPPLESGLMLLKVFSVIAPLLGLLGTVTGMIITFQQITLFGTGDPKLMAGGISTALVTTMLGLIVAIPLVLAHSFLRDRSKSLIQVLEEQAAGMIAQRAERESRGGAAV